MRVFVLGVTSEEIDALTARVQRLAGVTLAGRALMSAVARGAVSIPADVDLVITSRHAVTPALPAVDGRAPTSLVEQLTPRESAVLALVADGLPNREIARELEISEHTVKFHLASVFGKLGAASRTEAVRRALELGLIEI